MRRAKVIFHDGFNVSPFIETNNADLERRLQHVVYRGGSVAVQATFFLLQCMLEGYESSTIHNTPIGRSFGVTMAAIERPEFWPGRGEQAGVFLVDVNARTVQYWGGSGFEDSPEFTKAIPQLLRLEKPKDGHEEAEGESDGGPDDGGPSGGELAGSGEDLPA